MLDVIIPAYKDPEGLERTLQSVYYPELQNLITITVIDDCSPEKYDEIEQKYPTITFHHLPENHGPGYARQYGIEHTQEPYFIFVDCGDVIISKYSFLEIKDILEANPDYYLFLWTWVSERRHTVNTEFTRSTQGWIYKREFFNLYHITFRTDAAGSYAHEDVGFNRTCIAAVRDLEQKNDREYFMFVEIPIYRKIYHPSSITNTNNYRLNKMIFGLANNTAYSIKQLVANHISDDILLEELNSMMISLYKHFLRCTQEDWTTCFDHWKIIRKFYLETYKPFNKHAQNDTYQTLAFQRNYKLLLEYTPRPNFKRFLSELNSCEECPEFYYILNV